MLASLRFPTFAMLLKVVDEGLMGSRRHLNIRGKSASLPAITDKDWLDIDFGIEQGVDYYALSFVRDAQCIIDLKKYLRQHNSSAFVLAKIESADAVSRLDEILDAVDGAMVARGDLGAELPVEMVPFWQSKIVQVCVRILRLFPVHVCAVARKFVLSGNRCGLIHVFVNDLSPFFLTTEALVKRSCLAM